MPAKTEFESTFAKLRAILRKHAGSLQATTDSPTCYCLQGGVGPATLRAWGGKIKRPTMPVAWVEIGKAYVSFHVMALYGSKTLNASMSKELKARMQGKTCFNFKREDESLFKELEQLTMRGIAGMKNAGFVAD